MVLFKRKPVIPMPNPLLHDAAEVWAIEETGEIFATYEDYLKRIDFYRQKRFTCEVTSTSALTYKEALRSEKDASGEIDDAFPEPLRDPILRKVQFMQIPRIDHLVDFIFDVGAKHYTFYHESAEHEKQFRLDFYPGERVNVSIDEDHYQASIRSKTKFPELVKVNGEVERPAFARYFLELDQRPGHEAIASTENISRERKVYTKQRIRSFLKHALQRETWAGAPWIVKARLAEKYHLPTDIPPHLTQEAQAKSRKANISQGKKGDAVDGSKIQWTVPAYGPHQSLPAIRPKGSKNLTAEQQRWSNGGHPMDMISGIGPPPPGFQIVNGFHPIASKDQLKTVLPPPKYPIEDLEIAPKHDGTYRPALKFLSQDTPTIDRVSEGAGNGIVMESVGLLLETWDTLNVYCEVFQLDSFTLDDYLEALRLTSGGVQCELLIEIHCAVLKKLVNDVNDKNGQVQISLPFQPESEDESSISNDSIQPSPSPEPEAVKPPARSTRSSLIKSEAADLRDATNGLSLSETKLHRALEMDHFIRGYDWKQRLRKRDFQEGGWVIIIVGLLNQLSGNTRMTNACNDILIHLAPLDREPTPEVAFEQYQSLDINHRIKLLQILCLKSIETKAIRNYIDECAMHMTESRKEKNDVQKNRKSADEELHRLIEERKALAPDDQSKQPSVELEETEGAKLDPEEEDDPDTMEIDDSDDSAPHQGRSLRRATDRALARKQKAQIDKERKAAIAAEKSKKPSKQEKNYEKVQRKISEMEERIREYEEDIEILENDLRESDCHRTRVLGKDRFWNRYYWLERNAMPYGGLPESSTADAGYASGCIFVQGPDDMERQGFIELSTEENAQYRRAFQMTVPERKMKEEGETHVFTARQWGYYDDPDSVDMLIGWLDNRGVRELRLRKELASQRAIICHHMNKRKEYLTNEDEKSEDSRSEPVTRVSTRTKSYVTMSNHRCLAWKNSTAVRENGHLHSEPKSPATKKLRGVAQKKSSLNEVEEIVPVARATRGAAKGAEKNETKRTASGRLPTRQGSRYNF